MQAWKTQPRRLVPAEHEVHTLDGGAGGPFHEVVDGADGDDAAGAFVQFKADIGVVTAAEDLWFGVAIDAGLLFDEADERLVAIALAIGAPEIFFGHAGFGEKMGRGEDAAHVVDRGGAEMDMGFLARQPDRLQNLGSVAVTGGGEAAHHARPFGVVGRIAGLVAPLAAADLDFADHAATQIDQIVGKERPDRQVGGGRVAADTADIVGVGQFTPMEFGQPIDKLGQPRGIGVGLAIPTDIIFRVAQAEIGAQINDAPGQAGKVVDPLHRAAVGQAKKEQIAAFEIVSADKLQLGAPAQIGVSEMDERTGVPFACDLFDNNMGVVEQQPQQLATDIAGCADN